MNPGPSTAAVMVPAELSHAGPVADAIATALSRQGRRRRYRLFIEMLIAGSYLVDTLLLALFAWAGTVAASAPIGYGLSAMLATGAFLLLLGRDVGEGSREPYLGPLQRGCACLIQLAGMYFFPNLAFFFFNALFIVFAFTQMRAGGKHLALECALVIAVTAALMYLMDIRMTLPGANTAEWALVWLCYALTLARCAGLGYASMRLRGSLHELNQRFRALNGALESRVAERTRELQVKNDELAESNRQLQSFAYSVAHDFRQPLIAINGQSAMLARKLGHTDQDRLIRACLDRIGAASLQMESLCQGLTDLARVNRAELRLQPVDLSAMAGDIAAALQAREPQRRVAFEITPGLVAQADEGLMALALEILLGNAWKFSSKRPQARISFGCASTDGRREYFVRDNGAGFDAAYGEKLFGLFQRLHTDHEYQGMGIGLAILERVVRRHGGSVRAEGQVDAGAGFFFTL